MTLVGFESEHQESGQQDQQDSKTYVMLTVQQQQSANFYHHQPHQHHHHNRGNVIVSTDIKSEQQQNINNNNNNNSAANQMQQQRQAKRRAYGAANPPYGVVQPASVARRNARERNRVKQVNNGFATLRQHIPQHLALAVGANTAGTQGGAKAGNKKLSKVETLRMAVEYIRNLQTLLQEHQGLKSEHQQQQTIVSPKVEPDSDLENGQGYNNNNSHSDLGNESPLSGDDENTTPHYHHQYHYQSHHHNHSNHHHHRQSPVYVTSTGQCSSDASSSPTPSYVSETSSAGSQGYNPGGNIYAPLIENYENFPPVSPEDEDQLLDVITMWQY